MGEFFVGRDPGVGKGSYMWEQGLGWSGDEVELQAPVTEWQAGIYTAGYRAHDMMGNWSPTEYARLVVTDPNAGRVAASGFIARAGTSGPGGRLALTLRAGYGANEWEPKGRFSALSSKFKLRSKRLDWLLVRGRKIDVAGRAAVNGTKQLDRFRLSLQRAGRGGHAVLRVYRPRADVLTAKPLYQVSGNLAAPKVIVRH